MKVLRFKNDNVKKIFIKSYLHQEVVRLDVSMNKVFTVNIFDPAYQLIR